jgi:hypothetical protein
MRGLLGALEAVVPLRLGSGGILLMVKPILKIIVLYMRSNIRDDKNHQEVEEGRDDMEKDRKIKRLTQINR